MKVSHNRGLLKMLALAFFQIAMGNAWSADSANLTGRWEVTTVFPGGSYVAGLNLTNDANGYKGRGGYLVPGTDFPYRYAGAQDKSGLLHLQILGPDGASAIGELVLKSNPGVMTGTGKLHDVPITVTANRPVARQSDAPTVHNFEPQTFYGTFSSNHSPVLHIFPGDTVRTKTIDASGLDEKKVRRTLAGNAQTGPFYIEGAMVGDTIAVHFNKISPNRDMAFQNRALARGVLPPGYQQEPIPGWSSLWNLDREHGTATPTRPSEKLKNLTVKLVPMLGCVGVAPHDFESNGTSHLGPYGGNLDYREVREGTTLYLPVYQAGALLSVGDGHAAQADGEITGQGLETSMDVEFTVELIHDQLLDQPWAENDDYIMVSGIDRSLPAALQAATAGLSNWLRSYYGLNSAEIATLLANSIRYDIAEAADPEFHIVAKIGKEVLKQIPKPASPSTVFCQSSWGCDTSD